MVFPILHQPARIVICCMTANEITRRLLLEIPKRFQARAWRRNVGVGYGVDTVKAAVGALRRGDVTGALDLLTNRRPVEFGIPGEGDIAFVSYPGGVFGSIEVKAGNDRMRAEQEVFRSMVTRFGGIYVVARDVDGALAEISAEIERRKG